MEGTELPQIEILQTGKSFKILKVKGKQGIQMPMHHSTGEAIVIGQSGVAVLSMRGNEYEILRGSSTIIPAGEKHSLVITQDFQALVIMETNSKIES